MKNYYQILGLTHNCSPKEIKRAYRDHVKLFHPDKRNGDNSFEEKLIEIKEAYDVLIDEKMRHKHDVYHGFINEHDVSDNMNSLDVERTLEESIAWIYYLIQKKNYDSALYEANKAIKRFPLEGELYLLKGHIYRNLGQSSNALLSYEEAVRYGAPSARQFVEMMEERKAKNHIVREAPQGGLENEIVKDREHVIIWNIIKVVIGGVLLVWADTLFGTIKNGNIKVALIIVGILIVMTIMSIYHLKEIKDEPL